MRGKIVLWGLVSALVLFGSTSWGEVKIGYVNMQKAIQETSAGQKAKTQLEKEFKAKKKELKQTEADLKKMSEDLEKKALVLSEDVRAEKQQELQQRMMQYRQRVGKSQMEIQKKERELTLPILKKLREIIAKLAKEKDFTMVLEKSEQSVLWAKKEVDLTDEVIQRFEKKE